MFDNGLWNTFLVLLITFIITLLVVGGVFLYTKHKLQTTLKPEHVIEYGSTLPCIKTTVGGQLFLLLPMDQLYISDG